MPKRYGKAGRMAKLDAYADLYAKRIDPCASGAVVHVYKNPPGYEVEVIGADGRTLTVNTVSEAELLSKKEHTGEWDDFFLSETRVSDDFSRGVD